MNRVDIFAGIGGDGPGWRERAACREEDPDILFSPDRVDEAKALCAGCEVRAECLHEAGPGDEGVRGGMTQEERPADAARPRGCVLGSEAIKFAD